jgi:hypothetical protein
MQPNLHDTNYNPWCHHHCVVQARLRQVLAEPRNKASAPATAAAASTTSKQAKFKEQQEVREPSKERPGCCIK